ncbi:uncharacterized protein LOC111046006 [Nilaparvata lugens]|uniref:uncharacterized protein LOC111046006 n=1 Tax=Nilaparvata lugens TaxID=108931 RepID=UPI00193E3FC9|nr:uncharacterized protein LOC111046006 [Nilaparvata lugens]XP_039296539.1 uncharacterized protein LOC111046006 [Nilaparvata lugens]XP_039296540.1 uncharacterized protein LOC111046006 [Nilaparvata lugens]XP_039296541.1 uncharacterized protein LOC111046006 [Nilaparvata lugens]XP_039296542.1 uncharacterized protein LOC111046006 [Nilaparvata lugens]XP_039296543.1 uncharacterized protein LOC111046006 [Nilaparvata lugens]
MENLIEYLVSENSKSAQIKMSSPNVSHGTIMNTLLDAPLNLWSNRRDHLNFLILDPCIASDSGLKEVTQSISKAYRKNRESSGGPLDCTPISESPTSSESIAHHDQETKVGTSQNSAKEHVYPNMISEPSTSEYHKNQEISGRPLDCTPILESPTSSGIITHHDQEPMVGTSQNSAKGLVYPTLSSSHAYSTNENYSGGPLLDCPASQPSTSSEISRHHQMTAVADDVSIDMEADIRDIMLKYLKLGPVKKRHPEVSHNTFIEGLKYLGKVLKDSNVTELNLCNNNINCDVAIAIALNLCGTKITSLDLSRNEIMETGMNYLVSILNNSALTSLGIDCGFIDAVVSYKRNGAQLKVPVLDLYCCEFYFSDDYQCETFDNICKNIISYELPIKCLNVSRNSIPFKLLQSLSSLLTSCPITHFDLSDSLFDFEGKNLFVPILKSSQITHLNLSGNKIKFEAIHFLAEALKDGPCHLTELDVSHGVLNCVRLQELAPSLKGSNVTTLKLANNELDNNSISSLVTVLKDTQISCIDLSFNDIRCRSFKEFSNTVKHTKLTSLELCGIEICNECIECLGNVVEDNPQLISLNLSSNPINLKSMHILTSHLVNSNITSLKMGGLSKNNNDYNAALSCLLKSLKNTKVTDIDLGGNGLDFDQLKELGDCLADPKSNITSLDLSVKSGYNGREGKKLNATPCIMRYLADVLKNSKVTHLNLAGNMIKCNSLKNLVLNLPGTKLTSLDISCNQGICCSAFYLAHVLKNTRIACLNLGDNAGYYESCIDDFYRCFRDTSFTVGSGDALSSISFYFLSKVLKDTGITSIELSSTEADYAVLKYLSQGLLGSKVEMLKIRYVDLQSTGVQVLGRNLPHTQISRLCLTNARITNECFKNLLESLAGSLVTHLDVSHNHIDRNCVDFVATCLERTRIEELYLMGGIFELTTAKQLCESVRDCERNETLVVIGIRNEELISCTNLFMYPPFIEVVATVDECGVAANMLCNAYNNKEISKIIHSMTYVYLEDVFDNIDINELQLHRSHFHRVEEDYGTSNLALLEVNNVNYFDDTVILKFLMNGCFSRALKIIKSDNSNELIIDDSEFERKLKSIKFDDDYDENLQDLKIKHFYEGLEPVPTINNLGYLDLSSNNIRGKIFRNLVSFLVGSKIISLNLSNNKLKAGEAELLACILPKTNLTYIDLQGNDIKYEGFTYLMDVVEKTNICWLSLGDNGIELKSGKLELSPYIVPRVDTPIAFQMRYFFVKLVGLSLNGEFEFKAAKDLDDISSYAKFLKHVTLVPNSNIHIYDIMYMQRKVHDIQAIKKVDIFVENITHLFYTFVETSQQDLVNVFGDDCFLDLVRVFEELGMHEYVVGLLLMRKLYYVDDEQNILHPIIYKMLPKYGLPTFIEYLEPDRKRKMIDFFQTHLDIDGAQDIIDDLLSEHDT